MKKLRIAVIVLFLITSVVFGAVFLYSRNDDRTAPQIVSDGIPLEISVTATDRELCAGLTATDDRDGDITDRIIVRRVSHLTGSNSATINYAVFDSASNYCTFSRTVYYTDYSNPHFALSRPLSFNVSGEISLADRLTASDVIDGDITDRIRIAASTLSNEQPGEYPISVQVTNRLGDTSIADLTVLIQNVTPRYPVLRLSDYLIYVAQNSEFSDESLADYITEARTSVNGKVLKPDDITIEGSVDTSLVGSQFIRYSYTNDRDLTYTVILTVIVE